MKCLKLLTAVLLIFSFALLSVYSKPADNLLLEGIESGAEGKFNEAREFFNNILIADPDNRNAKRFLAVTRNIIIRTINEKAAVSNLYTC